MKRFLNFIVILIFFNACSSSTSSTRTQLEIREYQTKFFEIQDKNIIMKALLNTLLDEGYIIKNVNNELGVITAEKSTNNYEDNKKSNAFGVILISAIIVLTIGLILLLSGKNKEKDDKNTGNSGSGSSKTRYEKIKVIEASGLVSEFSNGYKVRIVFQYKSYDEEGKILDSKQILDENVYRDFFSKLDKSIFLQKELENK